jgi:hypothetical protein
VHRFTDCAQRCPNTHVIIIHLVRSKDADRSRNLIGTESRATRKLTRYQKGWYQPTCGHDDLNNVEMHDYRRSRSGRGFATRIHCALSSTCASSSHSVMHAPKSARY